MSRSGISRVILIGGKAACTDSNRPFVTRFFAADFVRVAYAVHHYGCVRKVNGACEMVFRFLSGKMSRVHVWGEWKGKGTNVLE